MSDGVIATFFGLQHRLARRGFWWGSIIAWSAFSILFVFLSSSLGRSATWILYPPFFWILFALSVKRLHDRGLSGVYLLWVLLPVLGPVWLIITLGWRAGTAGDNQYGADPRLVNIDYLTVKTP